MKAKKKYGQHFLIDNEAIGSIAEAIISCNENYTKFVEVGPGKGAISNSLISAGLDLKLIEIDHDMVMHLINQFPIDADIIIQKDVLEVNPYEIFDGEAFVLSGNFPYNISSQILFWMLSAHEIIPIMIGMFQKEVAERIAADPGNKQYGILSVLVQAIYDVEIILRLDAEAFEPAPKVESAVLRCTRKQLINLDYNQKLFKRIVKTTFNHRRKMLSNTLKAMVSDRSILKDSFFEKRPEQLSVDEFIQLTNQLEKYIVN